MQYLPISLDPKSGWCHHSARSVFACTRQWYLRFLTTEVQVGQQRAMTSAIAAGRLGSREQVRAEGIAAGASWYQAGKRSRARDATCTC